MLVVAFFHAAVVVCVLQQYSRQKNWYIVIEGVIWGGGATKYTSWRLWGFGQRRYHSGLGNGMVIVAGVDTESASVLTVSVPLGEEMHKGAKPYF